MPEEESNNPLTAGDDFTNVVLGLLVVLLVGRLVQNLPDLLADEWSAAANYINGFTSTGLYTTLFTIALAFSAACLAGAVYAVIRRSHIRGAQRRELKQLTQKAVSGEDTDNQQWQEILTYASSDDEELWRLAIIEADVMLDNMLDAAGYPQNELGAKLRNVERSDFHTIDQAWEAHKLRNVIAHEGSGYNLTKKEVQQAIDQYRQVFKEFGYI